VVVALMEFFAIWMALSCAWVSGSGWPASTNNQQRVGSVIFLIFSLIFGGFAWRL
jgi:hypothetical protein